MGSIEIDKQKVRALSSAIGVSERFAEILLARGVEDEATARRFLTPTVADIEDPYRLSGMQAAVDRIRTAVKAGEKIVVYGDYDCDGITATAILTDYLDSLGADVTYFIPNRFDTGYGLTIETLEEIAEREFPDLLITVDCGISSAEEATYLDEVLAIDLIVTDHHTLPEVLPSAVVVNPKLNPESECRDLCGAGVAFKLVQALGGMDAAWKYIELAAVATVADIVPLTGENRRIVALGLAKINSREKINKGLRLMIESVEFKREEISATDIAFYIVPRINALGRLGECSEVVTLFTSEEFLVLQTLIEKLSKVNELRKSLVSSAYQEALDLLKEYDLVAHRIILLFKPDWNAGILGLVASRLKTELSRPVVLLCGDDVLRGSARAPEGVNMYEILESAASVLVKFGGHKGAAGLTVDRDKVIEARNLMDDYLEKTYSSDVFSRIEHFDLALDPTEVNLSFARELALLEPTGEGNPKPVFRFETDAPFALFGGGAHVRRRLNDEAEIVGFNLAYLPEAVASGGKYDLLCDASIDTFKNRDKVRMRITDLYARGFARNENPVYLFNRYLRSNLYKEEPCELRAISSAEIADTLYDDCFGTLYVAFSEQGLSLVRDNPAFAGKIKSVSYGKNSDAPWNVVLFAPEDIPVGYRRIVLLDTPLGKGYAARLAKNTGAEVYVVKDNYPYEAIFSAADLGEGALSDSYQRIRRFVFSGDAVSSPMELMAKVSPEDSAFLIRFYVLFESGAISVGKGFTLSISALADPSTSLLYRRVTALKRKL